MVCILRSFSAPFQLSHYTMKAVLSLCTNLGSHFVQWPGVTTKSCITSLSRVWIQRSRRDALCPFSHHIPFHQGKSDPAKDFQARQDNLTCSKMTPLLSAPPRSPSRSPPISSRGAELAQMRDTLKNKLLIWDWVDSDGWPVLQRPSEKGGGWVSLLFQWIQGADVLPHMAFSQSKGPGH